MTVFCINLDRSPARWTFMLRQFSDLRMTVERISGIDGATRVPEHLRSQFAEAVLTSGEIGCYASHLIACEKIVYRSLPFAVVLEDDVTLDADFAAIAADAVKAAPEGWDYIHLSTAYKRAVVRISPVGCDHTLVRHTRLPVNTAAYIISQSGARKFLSPRPRVRPNDMDIRYGWLDDMDIYGVYPSIARQGNEFQSDIGGTHYPGHKEPRRRWSPGLASEFYGLVWQARKVGPMTLARAHVANIKASIDRRRTGRRHVTML